MIFRHKGFKAFAVVILAVFVLGGQGLAATSSGKPLVERNITFHEVAGEKLLLDIYRPQETTGTAPVVLLIHGGGWAGGDKRYHAYIAPPLVKAGYVAISANYRLVPKHPWPAAIDDCREALAWVREHAAEYGGDPNRIALLGESAGGHLSSLLGLLDGTSSVSAGAAVPPPVRAVVNIFGPADLTVLWEKPYCQKLLNALLEGSPEERGDLYRAASPLTHVRKGGPAFLHIHGTADPLVPVAQTKTFHAALEKSGSESRALILEGASHGWLPGSDYGKRSEAVILEFLQRHLRETAE